MAAAKDLTGKKFGRLVVLGLDPDPYISPSGKPTRRWRCRCDCGNEVVVLTNALTGKNGTRSCGCARRETMRKLGHDLTGKRFGRLLVLKTIDLPPPESNGNRRGWLCLCDCGNQIVRTQKNLELDGIRSCGCLLEDTARSKIVDKNILGHFQGTAVSAIRQTRKLNENNQSGVKGVYWSKRDKKWIAKIGVSGRTITIGRYDTLEAAKTARLEAEKKYFVPIIEEYDRQHKEPPK